MGRHEHGHGNWQLSTCEENRETQKRPATKNTGTPSTVDKHLSFGAKLLLHTSKGFDDEDDY